MPKYCDQCGKRISVVRRKRRRKLAFKDSKIGIKERLIFCRPECRNEWIDERRASTIKWEEKREE